MMESKIYPIARDLNLPKIVWRYHGEAIMDYDYSNFVQQKQTYHFKTVTTKTTPPKIKVTGKR